MKPEELRDVPGLDSLRRNRPQNGEPIQHEQSSERDRHWVLVLHDIERPDSRILRFFSVTPTPVDGCFQ